MGYIKSAYEDEDHFACERVLAFRKRFQRSSFQSAEQTPIVTGGAEERTGMTDAELQRRRALL